MGYKAFLLVDTECGLAEVKDLGGYTSRAGPMYERALPGPIPKGGRICGTGRIDPRGGLPGVSGLLGKIAFPYLRDAVEYMEGNAPEMWELEPWVGGYNDALEYLGTLRDACRAYPNALIGVSW